MKYAPEGDYSAPLCLARAAFSIADATCDWFECERTKFGLHNLKLSATNGRNALPHGEFIKGDGILTEWWLSNGAPLKALLADSAVLRSRGGRSQNGQCVYFSHEQGLITEEHAAHRDKDGRVRKCPVVAL